MPQRTNRPRRSPSRTAAVDLSRPAETRLAIRLDPRDYALAEKEAAALGIPVDEFVRRALREALRVARPAVPSRETGESQPPD